MPIWVKYLARGFFPSLFCCPSEKLLWKSYSVGSPTLITGSFQETAVICSYQPEGEKNLKGYRLTEAWLLLDLTRNHFSAVTHNTVFRQNMNKHVHKLLIQSNATLVLWSIRSQKINMMWRGHFLLERLPKSKKRKSWKAATSWWLSG